MVVEITVLDQTDYEISGSTQRRALLSSSVRIHFLPFTSVVAYPQTSERSNYIPCV